MLLSVILLASGLLLLGWRCLMLLEERNFWTVRLKIALYYEHFVIPYLLLLLLAVLKSIRQESNNTWRNDDILLQPVISFLALSISAFSLYYLAESRTYRKLRWKAWSGPSRTGIPPRYLRYIGNREDWLALSKLVARASLHPVEKFAALVSPSEGGIVPDPTELLKQRDNIQKEELSMWTRRSENNSDLYKPLEGGVSVSLLWGTHQGFRHRCSRGIISVPRSLLISSPRSTEGLDTRPINLACAILSRNKGLEPSSLICNLEKNNAFRVFEEGSRFWPRPAKTRRSQYRDIFTRMFSLLGEQYVAAATELALLVSDIPSKVLEDWLSGTMEQQDIDLNHKAAQNGAPPADLARLYRGQYAAMLVSLSLHNIGGRIRPEILVYGAVCTLEGTALAPWVLSSEMSTRRAQELQHFGDGVQAMIRAVV